MHCRGNLIRLLFILSSALLLIPLTGVQAADQDDLKPWQGDMPVRDSWLRKNLPEEALVYFRIPHPLGFLATPKGNMMDQALRSTGNITALQSIDGALIANVLEFIPGFEEKYLRDFADQLRSPIEVAVTLSPTPSMILSMNLDSKTNQEFADMVSAVEIGDAPLSLLGPLDAEGFGQLLGLPVPTSFNFDASTGQVLIQAGPSVSATQFAEFLEAIEPTSNHRMLAMEQRIDTSGYGLFAWIDAESALPAAQMFLDEDQLTELTASGLDKVRAIAFGWGAANDKGRMSVIVDMPRDGDRKFMPFINNKMSATSVGEPDAIVSLSIPTAEEFSRIEALALEAASDEDRASWLDTKAEMESELGITIEDILGAIGPEIIGIFDEVGDYVAVRLRDEDLFQRFVDQTAKIAGAELTERRYKRNRFYHSTFTSELTSLNADGDEEANFGALAFILGRQGEHLHWYRDGDFLYIATLPQPLIDRVNSGADTNIQEWLTQNQSMDLTDAFFGLTGISEKLPRRIYYVYIEMLQAIADLSEAEFDVWSMPTAEQAGLPENGALGFSINLGDPYLSIEFMFENNPLESIFSGDLTSVAALGVMAAIAIPAYQDYTIRANVSVGLTSAEDAKRAVSEHYRMHGDFPGQSAAASIGDELHLAEQVESIDVIPGSGVVVINFTDDAKTNGEPLFLEPNLVDDGFEWTCSSAIADNHLPAVCRGNTPPELVMGGT